ncbi:sensor domain-containing diguanylate cyclase [uncultured Sphaerochaeta sp.]|uniref:sensor domain-containing protein n=1 Tax=uncultured Sphaerochaeta sp. TaxID=886478 RepID=UPI002A0A1FC4|nr:sensor domain-containing diguanylate cyclase [uncultured Sphaerochaeta sp.]
MGFVDAKTVFLIYLIASTICSIVQISLWKENHTRFPELILIAGASILQVIGLFLLLLRNQIPNFFSIVLANTLILTGIAMLYRGLGKFTKQKTSLPFIGLTLLVYSIIHTWLTFVHPSLPLRNINTSLFIIILTTKTAWLMIFKVGKKMRSITLVPGVIIFFHSFLSLLNIFVNIQQPETNNLFALDSYNTFIFLLYMAIYISITFSLVLMINNMTTRELIQSEQKFSIAFKTSPCALSLSALEDGNLLDFNDAFITLSGFTRDELLKNSSLALKIWFSEAERTGVVTRTMKGLPVFNQEIKFRHKTGTILTCLFSTELLNLSMGPCLLSSTIDISDRISIDNKLRANRAFLSELIEHSGNLVSVKDKEGRYELVNNIWEKVTGFQRSEVLGKTDLELFPGSPGKQFRENDLLAIHAKQSMKVEEHFFNGKTTHYFLSHKFPMHDEFGQISQICTMTTDITELKLAEGKIEHLANYDFLTNLATRRLAMENLKKASEQAKANNCKGALLYLDLDGFKKINDSFGHNTGDLALVEVAGRLKACVTENDTVARIGGDEFMIILARVNSHQSLLSLTRSILDTIHDPLYLEGNICQISTSIGIALFPNENQDFEELVKKTDQAMYLSKTTGKNTWTLLP